MSTKKTDMESTSPHGFNDLVGGLEELLDAARRTTVQSVNAIMTATYWEIGGEPHDYDK